MSKLQEIFFTFGCGLVLLYDDATC